MCKLYICTHWENKQAEFTSEFEVAKKMKKQGYQIFTAKEFVWFDDVEIAEVEKVEFKDAE